MSTHDERKDAEVLHNILSGFQGRPWYQRMRILIHELGPNYPDEVVQFRELREAARESRELADALRDAGFGDLREMDVRRVKPRTGRLVQAFNRMIEHYWEPLE